MVRALRYLVVAGLLVLGTVAAAPATAAAPTAAAQARATPLACGGVTTGAVFGGYRSRMVCNSTLLDGFGTTAAAAQQNLNSMYNVATWTGVYCSTGTLPQPVSGGYRVTLTCNNKRVDGLGTTLTDVGNNLYLLADVAGDTGLYCGYTVVGAPVGGYRLEQSCNNLRVDGYAGTLTGAGSNGAAFARLAGQFGVYCYTATFQSVGGGFRIGLACNSRAVAGAGNTVTDAANNMYNFANLFATTGRYCGGAGYENVPGGKRVTMTCYPTGGYRIGEGATITIAAQNAYYAALAP